LGSWVSLPKVKKQVRPERAQEAKDARIECTGLVDCAVLASGKVERVVEIARPDSLSTVGYRSRSS
jgi:hypothetical protein